jgi:hypothetical protein
MSSLGILFPNKVVGKLAHLRGEEWQELVEHILSLPPDHPDSLAFGLMMVQICGCAKCDLHEYRLRRGCTQCALECIRTSKYSDKKLLRRFEKAQSEIETYLQERA